jgi:hypothetical protein
MAEKPHAMILEAENETGPPIKTFPKAASVAMSRQVGAALDMDDPPGPGGKGKAPALSWT